MVGEVTFSFNPRSQRHRVGSSANRPSTAPPTRFNPRSQRHRVGSYRIPDRQQCFFVSIRVHSGIGLEVDDADRIFSQWV